MKYRTQAPGFWLSLLVLQVEGWVFLWAASRAVVSSWREAGSADAAIPGAQSASGRFGHEDDPRPREFLGLPLIPETDAEVRQRAVRSGPRREQDPLQWLAGQLPGQRALLWVAVACGLLPWLSSFALRFIASRGAAGSPIPIINAGNTVFYFLSRALFAWVACRGFLELRRTGVLELLLSTPVGARELVSSHWRVLRQQLLWPLVVMVLLELPGLLAFMGSARFMPGGMYARQNFNQLMRPLNDVLEVLALCQVGFWFGLTARKPASAMTWTVGLVTGLPWLILNVFWLGLMTLRSPPTGRFGLAGGVEFCMTYFVVLSPILLLLKNLFFLKWARGKLAGDLGNATVQALATRSLKAGQVWEAVRRFLAPA